MATRANGKRAKSGANLISIHRRYKAHSGLRVTDV